MVNWAIPSFGAKFKNGHFYDAHGLGSKLVYRVIRCVDFDSDGYFILNPFLDGQLDHSKNWREIRKFTFLAIFALGVQIGLGLP